MAEVTRIAVEDLPTRPGASSRAPAVRAGYQLDYERLFDLALLALGGAAVVWLGLFIRARVAPLLPDPEPPL